MTPLDLAKHYFDLSNMSDLAAIRKLMTESTTFSADDRGVYLGVDQIMEMQAAFHGQFEAMGWEVTDIDEVRPGVVRLDFVFRGRTKTGKEVHRSGIEHVIVHKGKLQHIEVRRNQHLKTSLTSG